MDGLNRQKEIFLSGLYGKRPLLPLHYKGMEELARMKLSQEAFGYLSGGAGTGQTMSTNTSDLALVKILPSMAGGVNDPDITSKWEGFKLQAPIMLAPIGVLELAHPTADIGIAEASAFLDIPMIISSQSSIPMEQIAARLRPGQLKLFQLYHSVSDELSQSFIKRAEDIGCSGIVMTLDTTVLGWRTKDLQHGYSPFLHGRGIAQYTSDPVFKRLPYEEREVTRPPVNFELLKNMLTINARFPGSTIQNLRKGNAIRAIKKFSHYFPNPGLTWQDIERVRSYTKLPFYLKGIQTESDAKRARDAGANGIIISNHGGRQVDGGISTISCVHTIRKAVGPHFPVWMDSGIRSAADIYKSLASGADGCLIGRPYAMALACKGPEGVRELIQNLLAELALIMTLTGTADIYSINPTKIISPWIKE